MLYNENEKVILECDIKKWANDKINDLENLLSQKFIDSVMIDRYNFDENKLIDLINKYSNVYFYTNINFYALNHSNYKILYDCDLNGIHKFESTSVNLKIDVNDNFDLSLLDKIQTEQLFVEFYSRDNSFDLKKYMNILVQLKEFEQTIYFTSLFKYTKLLKKHPCNMYLCSNSHCHSNKSNIPRYLYMDDDGLYPYKLKDEKLCIIKRNDFNKFEEYIMNEYNSSQQHDLFIELNKLIFKNYVMFGNILVLPWNLLLMEALKLYEEDNK